MAALVVSALTPVGPASAYWPAIYITCPSNTFAQIRVQVIKPDIYIGTGTSSINASKDPSPIILRTAGWKTLNLGATSVWFMVWNSPGIIGENWSKSCVRYQ